MAGGRKDERHFDDHLSASTAHTLCNSVHKNSDNVNYSPTFC